MTLRVSLQAVPERENYCKLKENTSLLSTPANLISILV